MQRRRASRTALSVAAAVVHGSRRPDLADLLPADSARLTRELLQAGPRPIRWLTRSRPPQLGFRLLDRYFELSSPGSVLHLLVRKRWFDDECRRAVDEGAGQVIVLGGGLDTLALRFARERPDLNVLEFDHPATQALKKTGIERTGAVPPNLALVPLDLTTRSLAATLAEHPCFRPDVPAVVVAEGLLMYLSASQVDDVFALLREPLAPTSRLLLSHTEVRPDGSHVLSHFERTVRVRRWLEREPFLWGIPVGGRDEELRRRGLRILDAPDLEQRRRRYLAGRGEPARAPALADWEHFVSVTAGG